MICRLLRHNFVEIKRGSVIRSIIRYCLASQLQSSGQTSAHFYQLNVS